MSKKKKHIQTEKERLYQKKAARAREEAKYRARCEERRSATVIFCITLALFLAFVGFFSWHTVRMRDYESNFVRVTGTITGYTAHHSSGRGMYYYLKISYSCEGKSYEFSDREGYRYVPSGTIGKNTEIYVNPQAPERAEKVSSADFVSIICACFYAFFAVTYAVGANLFLSAKGSTFSKRFFIVWGAEILLGLAVLLLFWTGLPHSGFGAVFTRIRGAACVLAVTGVASVACLLDGVVTGVLRSKQKIRFRR